jgi:hypothetical protein
MLKWFRNILGEPDESIPAIDLKTDLERQAFAKIRNICEVASAGSVAQFPGEDLAKRERQRFESARRLSLELAKQIEDVSLRDSALEGIIQFCLKANDLNTPRILVRGIQSPAIRDRLLEDHPVIFY